MSLTFVAFVGIAMSMVFLIMGFVMERHCEPETPWIKGKETVKRVIKKRPVRMVHRRKAA